MAERKEWIGVTYGAGVWLSSVEDIGVCACAWLGPDQETQCTSHNLSLNHTTTTSLSLNLIVVV